MQPLTLRSGAGLVMQMQLHVSVMVSIQCAGMQHFIHAFTDLQVMQKTMPNNLAM